MASGAATIVGPGSRRHRPRPGRAGPRRDPRRRPPRGRLGGPDRRGWSRARCPRSRAPLTCPLPASAIEDFAPLTAVAPVALLAFVLARLRGHDPDHPGWVERYHSQGLDHIIGVGYAEEG